MNLSDYVQDTSAILRDSNNLFTSLADLKRYINQARYQIALKTGCIRVLVPGQAPFGSSAVPGTFLPGAAIPSAANIQFQTLQGVEKYPYGYANPFIQRLNQGVKGVIDVIDVAVSWGGIRPNMNWVPWEDLQAYARSYNVGVFSYPFLWSTNGDGENGQIWLFPVPSIPTGAVNTAGFQGEMEWDCTCVPKPIYTDDDVEALPEPFQQYVKFYAAYLSLMAAQRYGAAGIHWQYLDEHLNIGRVASDRGKVPNWYYMMDKY